MYLIIRVEFRADWKLFVVCHRDNIVIWFCSLHKKPNIKIKAAINKLSFKL